MRNWEAKLVAFTIVCVALTFIMGEVWYDTPRGWFWGILILVLFFRVIAEDVALRKARDLAKLTGDPPPENPAHKKAVDLEQLAEKLARQRTRDPSA